MSLYPLLETRFNIVTQWCIKCLCFVCRMQVECLTDESLKGFQSVLPKTKRDEKKIQIKTWTTVSPLIWDNTKKCEPAENSPHRLWTQTSSTASNFSSWLSSFVLCVCIVIYCVWPLWKTRRPRGERSLNITIPIVDKRKGLPWILFGQFFMLVPNVLVYRNIARIANLLVNSRTTASNEEFHRNQ